MKLVLKFNQNIKLFPEEPNYDRLVQFIVKEFKLPSDAFSISFIDQEGDSITILSDQDLTVMQDLLVDSEYLKVVITQTREITQKTTTEEAPTEPKLEEIEQDSKLQAEEKKEEPKEESKEEVNQIKEEVKEKGKEAGGEERHGGWKERCQGWRQWKGKCHGRGEWKGKHYDRRNSHQKEGSDREGGHHGWKKARFQMLETFLKETVTKLVDERVKALVPCIKEQLSQPNEQPLQLKEVLHEGFQCKACQVRPITGIRYECLTCVQFNLCQKCEARIDHQHNLLKVKKLIEKKEDQQSQNYKLFKDLWRGDRRGSSSSHDRCPKWKKDPNFFTQKKCWKLSAVFGGQSDSYKEFVDKNKYLRGRQTIRKYAEEVGMKQEQLKERIINMKCQKLQACFQKPAEGYRKFVEENQSLNVRELIRALCHRGLESMEGRRGWGKRYRFNGEVSDKEQKKVQDRRSSKKFQVEKKQELEVRSGEIGESLVKQIPIDTRSKIREKGSILLQMKEIFGDEGQKAYYKFIDDNFQHGAERIIEMYINQIKTN